MKQNLIFCDTNMERVHLLQQGFQAHPQITASALTADELRSSPDLDAFYLSIMAAEKWGAAKSIVIHEAQILRTTPSDQADGWPPFVIAGLALKEGEDPFDARFCLSLIIQAVLKAVKVFNNENSNVIQTIGFEPGWTGMEDLPALEAAQIVCDAYDEVMV